MAEIKEYNIIELKSYKEKRKEFLESIQPQLQVIDIQGTAYKAPKKPEQKVKKNKEEPLEKDY